MNVNNVRGYTVSYEKWKRLIIFNYHIETFIIKDDGVEVIYLWRIYEMCNHGFNTK